MANIASILTGPLASVGGLTNIDLTTARNDVGMESAGTDANGNPARYIYMQGVASCLRGSWVAFDELFIPTLLIANGLGRVAIAMAAIDATTSYGWYAIQGAIQGLCLASYADNAKVWATSTAGSVDDADVAVDLVINAIGRSNRATTGANSGMALFQIYNPFALNEVYN